MYERTTRGIFNSFKQSKSILKINIRKIDDPELKSRITSDIITSLPDWFGIPESNMEYTEGVKPLPFWAAYLEGEYVGSFAAKKHYNLTADIYVCAIKQNFHNKGIGSAIYYE